MVGRRADSLRRGDDINAARVRFGARLAALTSHGDANAARTPVSGRRAALLVVAGCNARAAGATNRRQIPVRPSEVHMPFPLPRSRAVLPLLAVVLAGILAPSAMASSGGALYTQTNDPAGNTVQAFSRGPGGALAPAGTFATGGAGLATLGGRQGAVELSGDGRSPVRGQRGLRQRLGVPDRPPRPPARGHRPVARRRADEHRRGPRPRVRPQLRRHAERERVLAPVRRVADADSRRHPRARARRRRRRAGLGDP